MTIIGEEEEPGPVAEFRLAWRLRGYDLVDVTPLLSFSLGNSGWANNFNEPDEPIYHVKVKYRGEEIGSLPELANLDERFTSIFVNEDDVTGADFIVFRKVKRDD